VRLYAYHNGEKHEVDLALFPVELNEEGDVVFTEDQYDENSNRHLDGYRKGKTIEHTPASRIKLPLVGGGTLIGTFRDWLVQSQALRLYALHNGEKYEVDTVLFPIFINERGEVARMVRGNPDDGEDENMYYEEELKSIEALEQLPLVNGSILMAKVTEWLVEP